MKHLFLSLCLIVPMMWGTSMHAYAADDSQDVAQNVVAMENEAIPVSNFIPEETAEELFLASEEAEQGLGIEQATPIPKGRSSVVYPLVYLNIQEMFTGPCFKVIHTGETLPLKEGTYLQLTDQSLWQVNDVDRLKLSKWRPGHLITLQPNKSWFDELDQDFPCIMYNLHMDESVRVNVMALCARNMVTMPGLECCIDFKQDIVLEHGTRWHIPTEYYKKISGKWVNGNVIIIGIENDYWSDKPYNCLINLTNKDSCRAVWVR